eukprot:CAMPEP_0119511596 /NCGR_PEP_ID=MMETSP1344-20130328/30214_1 /TAXON_ID=236787 /ORGANISM="Florenciella parvula, Strain CCMP2471" /LENGTH=42 /DNA_ID= /DNA_START= /DNA_END= /DNA_ORIENTATION=
MPKQASHTATTHTAPPAARPRGVRDSALLAGAPSSPPSPLPS